MARKTQEVTANVYGLILSEPVMGVPEGGGDVRFQNSSGLVVDIDFVSGDPIPKSHSGVQNGEHADSHVTPPAKYRVSAPNTTVEPVNGEIIIQP
jgi:hypothetical protein